MRNVTRMLGLYTPTIARHSTTTPYHGETYKGDDRGFPKNKDAEHGHRHEGQHEVHDQLVVENQVLLRGQEDSREPERLRVKRGQARNVSGVVQSVDVARGIHQVEEE